MTDDLSHLTEDIAPEAPAESVLSLIQRMLEAKAAFETSEAMTKMLKATYDELRKRTVPDALAAAGVKNLKLASGETVYLTTKLEASVPKDLRESLYAWLRDNGHGSLVCDYVWPQTLTAFVKELREHDAPLPPMVTVFEEPTAAVRKS